MFSILRRVDSCDATGQQGGTYYIKYKLTFSIMNQFLQHIILYAWTQEIRTTTISHKYYSKRRRNETELTDITEKSVYRLTERLRKVLKSLAA